MRVRRSTPARRRPGWTRWSVPNRKPTAAIPCSSVMTDSVWCATPSSSMSDPSPATELKRIGTPRTRAPRWSRASTRMSTSASWPTTPSAPSKPASLRMATTAMGSGLTGNCEGGQRFEPELELGLGGRLGGGSAAQPACELVAGLAGGPVDEQIADPGPLEEADGLCRNQGFASGEHPGFDLGQDPRLVGQPRQAPTPDCPDRR